MRRLKTTRLLVTLSTPACRSSAGATVEFPPPERAQIQRSPMTGSSVIALTFINGPAVAPILWAKQTQADLIYE